MAIAREWLLSARVQSVACPIAVFIGPHEGVAENLGNICWSPSQIGSGFIRVQRHFQDDTHTLRGLIVLAAQVHLNVTIKASLNQSRLREFALESSRRRERLFIWSQFAVRRRCPGALRALLS